MAAVASGMLGVIAARFRRSDPDLVPRMPAFGSLGRAQLWAGSSDSWIEGMIVWKFSVRRAALTEPRRNVSGKWGTPTTATADSICWVHHNQRENQAKAACDCSKTAADGWAITA